MEKITNAEIFNDLYAIDVSDRTEDKQGLTYLSWALAWAEAKKQYPDINYKIKKFGENELPYTFDEKTGYMVFTEVTIGDLTYEMWLPVMDYQNRAMKVEPYEITFKSGAITVEPATMFDINKTIMRCLVKNLAMFGLGLYIYAGEDLPENEDGKFVAPPLTVETAKDINVGFGKHKGKTLGEISEEDESYLKWLADKSNDAKIKEGAKLVLNPETMAESEKPVAKMFEDRVKEVAELTGQSVEKLDEFILKEVNKELDSDSEIVTVENKGIYNKYLRLLETKAKVKARENQTKKDDKDNSLFEGNTTNPVKWGE